MDTYRVIDSARLQRQLYQVRLQHARIPPKTCFYDLPVEIRLVIYETAYYGIPIKVLTNTWCRWKSSTKRHDCWQLDTYRDLLVDKQYYNEAIRPFYHTAVWHFLNLAGFGRFAQLSSSPCRDAIKSVVVPGCCEAPGEGPSRRLWSTKLRRNDFPRLEDLTVHAAVSEWRKWMLCNSRKAMRHEVENQDNGANLLTFRGLKSFSLGQEPGDQWWINLTEEVCYRWHGEQHCRPWAAVARQLEAMISEVVCQPRSAIGT